MMLDRLYFVYGTLRKGYGNHILVKDMECIGEFTTKGVLYVQGGLPFVDITKEGIVTGEIYRATGELSRYEMEMDRMETSSGYLKYIVVCTTKWLMPEQTEHAYIYTIPYVGQRADKLIEPSGDYSIAVPKESLYKNTKHR